MSSLSDFLFYFFAIGLPLAVAAHFPPLSYIGDLIADFLKLIR